MIICEGRDSEEKDDEAVHGSQYVSQLIFQAASGAQGRLLCMYFYKKQTSPTAHALWIYTRGHEFIDGSVA
jgi:hypothetical protein